MLALISVFFLIALLYSMVGFGGGSSYIAALAVSGIGYAFIPKISLLCNLVVVTGGCYHYFKKGYFSKKLLLPFVLSSVPMAFVGGIYPIKERAFLCLLALTLVLAGARILFVKDREVSAIRAPSFFTSIVVGSVLGLLSGMVGIGGGIFLSPILINMGWARSKNAAAVASAFIWLNSVAGLAGQFAKDSALPEPAAILPLLAAVVVGGQIGSRIGTHSTVSHTLVQRATGLLTLLIAGKLLLQYISL